ncbi:MAG: hypothetical protein KAX49_00250 [Halanaerobiales bacterium]|nr:hypothetical protein [Halanaerobiales bacterium]
MELTQCDYSVILEWKEFFAMDGVKVQEYSISCHNYDGSEETLYSMNWSVVGYHFRVRGDDEKIMREFI